MPQVASDPVVQRPLRPESVSGRAGAPAAEPSASFEGLLDTAQIALASTDKTLAKLAEALTTPQANGDPAAAGQFLAIKTEVMVPVMTAEVFAAIAETIPVKAKGDTTPALAEQTVSTSATSPEVSDDAGVAAPADSVKIEAAASIMVGVSAPTPVNSPPAATPASLADIAPVTAADRPAALPAPAGVPAIDTGVEAEVTAPANAGHTKPQDAPPAAAVNSANSAPAGDVQKAAPPELAALAKTPATKSDILTDKADKPGKTKSGQQGRTDLAANAQTSAQAGAPVAKHGADAPAEHKAPRVHHLHTQSAEPATPAHPAEPHADIAATPAIPAQPAQPAAAQTGLAPAAPADAEAVQVNGNTPVASLNLAAPAAPLPTLWPMTALRVDTTAHATVPVAGLAVEIVARAQDGLKRFEIRLDPPELGRIDVRLDVDHGGKVTSRLVVERAETLDLLRRDAPSLERALQHAGLNTEGGLEFSLRDQNFAGRDQAPRDTATVSQLIIPDDEAAAAEAARRGYGRQIGLGGGVDIRV